MLTTLQHLTRPRRLKRSHIGATALRHRLAFRQVDQEDIGLCKSGETAFRARELRERFNRIARVDRATDDASLVLEVIRTLVAHVDNLITILHMLVQ